MFHYIDDEATLRDLFVDLMKEFGHNAMSFSCPIEYLNYMDSPDYAHPNAVFTDIDMPKMSGFELIGNIVKANRNLKIAVISGRADIKHENQKHVCFFIEKPFHPNQLKEITSSLIKCYFEGSDSVKFKCSKFGEREEFTHSDFQCPHKKNMQ